VFMMTDKEAQEIAALLNARNSLPETTRGRMYSTKKKTTSTRSETESRCLY